MGYALAIYLVGALFVLTQRRRSYDFSESLVAAAMWPLWVVILIGGAIVITLIDSGD